VALIICSHTQVLLDDSPGGGMLQVKQVLHTLGHRNHAGVEVRTLGVRHGLKVLPPHRVSLIASWEERNWYRGGVGEAAPIQGSEGDLCRLLDDVF
jgi:hypothetical protein